MRGRLSVKGYEVVDVQLLSTFRPRDFRLNLTKAKKENIRAVLELLAGRPVAEKVLKEVDPEGQLQAATRMTWCCHYVSSHGYADPQGNFYVVPYETGKPAGVSEGVYVRLPHPVG